jgi:1,4-dihydroxy-6-naphthoate synthase
MGGPDYGPRIIATSAFNLGDGRHRRIAIPGLSTSATLALKLFLAQTNIAAELVAMHFDKIQDAVRSGEVDAGVIIHEGQITHAREGFVMVQDLGKWWWDTTGLPLPLGINIVRKDLGAEGMLAVATVVKQSILYSLDHRREALAYALSFGRGISYDEADRFVGMYVNDYTIELGDAGRRSIALFLERGVAAGFIPRMPEIEFVDVSAVGRYESRSVANA